MHNNAWPRGAYPHDETTEERLFKFSPLSSKKFEEASSSNNTATPPLFVN